MSFNQTGDPCTRVCLIGLKGSAKRILCDVLLSLADCREIGEFRRWNLAEVLALKPDVVVAQLNELGFENLSSLREMRAIQPDGTNVMVLVKRVDRDEVHEALDSGVSGIIPVSASKDDLKDAIRTVAGGGAYLSPEVRRVLTRKSSAVTACGQYAPLTPRESEILTLLAQGLAYKQIAGRLRVSVNTVNVHLANVRGKLGAHSAMEAVNKMFRPEMQTSPNRAVVRLK